MLPLFRIPDSDYKRFMDFLRRHHCNIDFREYQEGLRLGREAVYFGTGANNRAIFRSQRPASLPSLTPSWCKSLKQLHNKVANQEVLGSGDELAV